jgi:hypothetical protein
MAIGHHVQHFALDQLEHVDPCLAGHCPQPGSIRICSTSRALVVGIATEPDFQQLFRTFEAGRTFSRDQRSRLHQCSALIGSQRRIVSHAGGRGWQGVLLRPVSADMASQQNEIKQGGSDKRSGCSFSTQNVRFETFNNHCLFSPTSTEIVVINS